MSVIFVPIVISSDTNNSLPTDDDCLCCLCCCPCFSLMKLWECIKARKKKGHQLSAPQQESVVLTGSKSIPKMSECVDEVQEKEKQKSQRAFLLQCKQEQDKIIEMCQREIGKSTWELLERGSHNASVINVLKQQPKWVLDHIFKDVHWTFGKERLLFLQEQLFYQSSKIDS